jgi:hypothetical protein
VAELARGKPCRRFMDGRAAGAAQVVLRVRDYGKGGVCADERHREYNYYRENLFHLCSPFFILLRTADLTTLILMSDFKNP